MIFDSHQNLKATIGVGTRATESGSITSVALSADFYTVAGGHSNGNIFTWEIARPAKPFLQILSTDTTQLQSARIDGHVLDVAILHVGFLGTRHTALVSADDKGMAFSHLASRGLGAIARSVKTTRILGRYPETGPIPARPRKPSSVLAFAPLPLGNVESASDSLGLVALLTPYLLVVVSTTPIAQTQYKAPRPKDLAAHGAMTAALAWYPAMRTKHMSFNAKLAYCWLNVVMILDLEEIQPTRDAEKDRPVDLQFTFQKRWEAEESVVGIQWLNRSVLAVLTLSQRLIILEDESLTVPDSSDLIKKHIYHVDLFSRQLDPLIENLDEDNLSMHGVVADAFYMSFKAYKGRLFLLGFNDITVGTLSNWADRLFALMEQGDFIGAIQLATSYYAGGADKAAIGLPADDASRHVLVKDKLIEMIAASLRYAFGKNPDSDTTRVSESQLDHLLRASFVACLMLKDTEFLFDEIYGWYSENGFLSMFLRLLESFISDGEIRIVPPTILKDLVNDFMSRGFSARLEEILCLLDPSTMDLDQITALCKKYMLHDALFYIWSQAIGDYVTIFKDMLDFPDMDYEQYVSTPAEHRHPSKIFPFLSYTLTGRVYPTGDWLREDKAFRAKADVYHALFSGSSGKEAVVNSFHYLRKLLDLDTSSFMSMLNEAFEDNFLDEISESVEDQQNLTLQQRFGVSLTRQFIIRILLEVLVPPDYKPEDIIYLDMFIARNQPKFSQFIRLPGNILHRVFIELCSYGSDDISDDCQLSVEYLLSVYQPPDLSALLPLLRRARFFRVIKSIYKSEKQYAALLRTCFADEASPQSIFECVEDCFSPSSSLGQDQLESLRQIVVENATKFLYADLKRAATVIHRDLPNLHGVMIEVLENDHHAQYIYLKEILGVENEAMGKEQFVSSQPFVELYVRLLCDYNPGHVTNFIENLESGDLRLGEVLPALEQSGSIDAAVILMAREGNVRDAMNRLVQHLRYLETALLHVLDKVEDASVNENPHDSVVDLVRSVEKYGKVGLWLCQKQTRAQAIADSFTRASTKRPSYGHAKSLDTELSGHEVFWLDLIYATVRIIHAVSDVEDIPGEAKGNDMSFQKSVSPSDFSFVLRCLRTVVQDTFTGVLAATSPSTIPGQPKTNLSFLRILRAFLNRVSKSSPSLSHLRSVLSAIFSAYAYEENLLSLANQLLSKDLYIRIEAVSERRKRGWRPSGQTCSGCGLRLWGPGVDAGAWEAWNERQKECVGFLDVASSKPDTESHSGKGKRRATDAPDPLHPLPGANGVSLPTESQGTLVIFSCRHSYHKQCLDDIVTKKDQESQTKHETSRGKQDTLSLGSGSYRCPLEQNTVEIESSS